MAKSKKLNSLHTSVENQGKLELANPDILRQIGLRLTLIWQRLNNR